MYKSLKIRSIYSISSSFRILAKNIDYFFSAFGQKTELYNKYKVVAVGVSFFIKKLL